MLLEELPVDDLHIAAPAIEHSCRLQPPGDQGYRRAADAQHLRQRALRQRDLFAAAAILHFEEPAADAGLDRMDRVAQRGLLGLCEKGAIETGREPPHGRALIEEITES